MEINDKSVRTATAEQVALELNRHMDNLTLVVQHNMNSKHNPQNKK